VISSLFGTKQTLSLCAEDAPALVLTCRYIHGEALAPGVLRCAPGVVYNMGRSRVASLEYMTLTRQCSDVSLTRRSAGFFNFFFFFFFFFSSFFSANAALAPGRCGQVFWKCPHPPQFLHCLMPLDSCGLVPVYFRSPALVVSTSRDTTLRDAPMDHVSIGRDRMNHSRA
jgi:hypothetical protein